MGCVYKFGLVVVLVGLFGGGGTSWAIASLNRSASEADPAASDYSIGLDYVYRYKESSAVAVGRYWLLTAAHVADDATSWSMELGGVRFVEQDIYFHENADLALVRLDQPLPGFYSLFGGVPVGEEVVMAGYGYPGNVVIGETRSFFEEDSAGSCVLRWGTSRIDAEVPIAYTLTDSYKGIRCRLSVLEAGELTALEAGPNKHDSGGAVFYSSGGVWKLVGIMTKRLGANDEYTGFNAVALAHYLDWIAGVVYQSDAAQQLDSDGDGITDAGEWICASDPLNPSDCLKLTSDGSDQLWFPGATNREYVVEFTTDLAADPGSWQSDEGWVSGTSSQMQYAVPTELPDSAFFRVRARMP